MADTSKQTRQKTRIERKEYLAQNRTNGSGRKTRTIILITGTYNVTSSMTPKTAASIAPSVSILVFFTRMLPSKNHHFPSFYHNHSMKQKDNKMKKDNLKTGCLFSFIY
ncbi:MAG: hypothetical protein LKH78_11100 [Weizmannia coagulans]|nr:hypothetical protein [Heyndrickxia coagulans]